MLSDLTQLEEAIAGCAACSRLVDYRACSAAQHPDYWSRPVCGFGDPTARLFILGLAPGFHGANRTGRVFTGDDSGRWLYGALHELGACSEPNSTHRNQPLRLSGVWISNAARCVPPQNRPLLSELEACRPFVEAELRLLRSVRLVLALGRIAHDTYLKTVGLRPARFPFAHGAEHRPADVIPLLDSYHPSRQNTHTGVLKWEMWVEVIEKALAAANSRSGRLSEDDRS